MRKGPSVSSHKSDNEQKQKRNAKHQMQEINRVKTHMMITTAILLLVCLLTPSVMASPNSLRRRLLPCSSDADCFSAGPNYCCSNLGQCGTGTAFCDLESPSPFSGGCPPAYVEGYIYEANEEAAHDGKTYACKPYPETGWCQFSAYAPGTGTHWQAAWVFVGDCGDSPQAPIPPQTNTSAKNLLQALPSPPSVMTTSNAMVPSQTSPSASTRSKTIIGYYASWQWYDRSGLAKPTNMDFSKVDRVNFAFFQVDTDGNIWGTDSWADAQVLFGPQDWNPKPEDPMWCSWDAPTNKTCNPHHFEQGLIGLVHEAGGELYPSIGGWTLSDAFPAMAASASARTHFANKCVELIQDYNFDGIDLDWEYPGYADHLGTPEDTNNFNLLLDELRSKLDGLTAITGKHYGITAALPCSPAYIGNIDVAHVSNVLDELNLMTYDFHGAWDGVTGVNAPMNYQGFGPNEFSVDDCVANWVAGGGLRTSINIGLPFYGRSFAGAKGLNEMHHGADIGDWGEDDGSPQYFNIVSKLDSMTSIRDEQTKTQYAYFNDGAGLVSYDDEQAICDKTEYVIENNLNGFIIWELSGDLMPDLSTPLLDAVNAKLANKGLACGASAPP